MKRTSYITTMFWICFAFMSILTLSRGQNVYQIGVGIGDITGPAAEIGMMGYAKSGQDTAGIHQRLFSRAFVLVDERGTRVCLVNTDLAMISQAVKLEIVKSLKEKYGDMYNEANVLLSATHTHSGPGGYLQYVLYIITTQGFIKQSFEAVVRGILRSIDRAHAMAEKTKGSIYFNEGDLLDASINRSPTAYMMNPPSERAKYPYDTDKGMQVLKFVDTDGKPLGMISWFPVHCTSMNNTNRLISGDNKGYAAYVFEREMNPESLPGKGHFVAAFVNSNEGDVSPNTNGPRCIDTGLVCDVATSTCGGQNEKCISTGPGRDMFESTKIIGEKQYEKARRLFDTAQLRIEGPLGYVHQYIDMSNVTLTLHLPNGNATVTTCKPAMGYSFAAGTTDGPGAFDFQQGVTKSTPFWNLVRDFMRRPSPELTRCHYPKPILVATGEMKFPYQWQPTILPLQIIRIGSVLNVALPAEFTTMPGRRVREAVLEEAKSAGGPNGPSKTVLSGLSNAYSSYVVTPEEYQAQRYEGASTIFGSHTLPAYIIHYRLLTRSLVKNTPLLPSDLQPPYLLPKQISLKPGVVYDGVSFGKKFGDIVYDVQPRYSPGDQVYVAFIAANPRNNLQQERSFLTIERKDGNHWYILATDADWETKFYWHRTNSIFGESQATITWDIPKNVSGGVYRIRHFGASKNLLQAIKPYVGISSEFEIV